MNYPNMNLPTQRSRQMKGRLYIKQIRAYCDYLEEHLNNVEKAWNIVKSKCKNQTFSWDDFRYFSIHDMIQLHDISKFSKAEFIPYVQKFFPVESEVFPEEQFPADFDKAWEHHKEHNPHHWENWATKDHYHPYAEECHIVCMICDWMAMGMKFGDTAREYYEKNKDSIGIPKQWEKYMYSIFDEVESNTEEVTP
jgi:hypothetical protein